MPDGKIGEYLIWLKEATNMYDISTHQRLSFFLAQIAHESNGLRAVVENLNYSAEALLKVFGKYFPDLRTAKEYERQPEKIGNLVYANRMGNNMPGDGYRYRGRGFIQITGKNNYREMSGELGVDLIANPKLLETPEYAAKSAAAWWWRNGLNEIADSGDFRAATKKINGGYHGIEDRLRRLLSIHKVMNV